MKNIFKALADFQQEVPVIHQDTQGYNYTYTSLKTIIEVIKPLLKEHGLGYTQLLSGTGLKTILFHVSSGETLESTAELPVDTLRGMNAYQSAGSAITYFRRYSLSAALGLITDKDIDAQTSKLPISNFENVKAAVKRGTMTLSSLKESYIVTKEQEEELKKL